MSAISFSPGNLLTIAHAAIVIVCGQDTPDDAFDDLKAATDSNAELGLAIVPVRQLLEIEEFVVLVNFDGNVHLLHRGSLSIELTTASMSPTSIGNPESANMVTWFETKLPLEWNRINIYDPKLRRRTLRTIDSNFLSVSEIEVEPQFFFPSTESLPRKTVEAPQEQEVLGEDKITAKVDQLGNSGEPKAELEVFDGIDRSSETESALDTIESDEEKEFVITSAQDNLQTNSADIDELDNEVKEVEEQKLTALHAVDQEISPSEASQAIPESTLSVDIKLEEADSAVRSSPQIEQEKPKISNHIFAENSTNTVGEVKKTHQGSQSSSTEKDADNCDSFIGLEIQESQEVGTVDDVEGMADGDEQVFGESSQNESQSKGSSIDQETLSLTGEDPNTLKQMGNPIENLDLSDDGFNLEHTSTQFYQNMINFRKGIQFEPLNEGHVDKAQSEETLVFEPVDSDDQLTIDQGMAPKESEPIANEIQFNPALRDALITNSPFASEIPPINDDVAKPPRWGEKPSLPNSSPAKVDPNAEFSPRLDEDFDIESTVNLKHKSQSSANAAIKHPISAVRCRGGHLNNPTLLNCPKCGQSIAVQEAFTVERPVLGVIKFGDGSSYKIDGPKRIGRNPIRDSILEGESAETIIVGTGDNAISRDHVIITISQWQVLVTDNNSTNGTMVRRNDGRERRLNANRPEPIGYGSRIELSDDVWFDFIAEEM
jgi:hypothetical protein